MVFNVINNVLTCTAFEGKWSYMTYILRTYVLHVLAVCYRVGMSSRHESYNKKKAMFSSSKDCIKHAKLLSEYIQHTVFLLGKQKKSFSLYKHKQWSTCIAGGGAQQHHSSAVPARTMNELLNLAFWSMTTFQGLPVQNMSAAHPNNFDFSAAAPRVLATVSKYEADWMND